jgi:uncharacterized protein
MISRLKKQNSWWTHPSAITVDSDIQDLNHKKYVYHHPLEANYPVMDGVFLLRGPRQIGKSTLFKSIIKDLLTKKGVNPHNIFYFTCDTVLDLRELYEIVETYLENIPSTQGRRYIFLDEVTYISEWQRAIKQHSDQGNFKNTTVFLTGSNIIDVKQGGELLPGRRGDLSLRDLDHFYYPIRFGEFVHMSKTPPKGILEAIDQYMVIGGFPNIINEYFTSGYVSDSTYETYLQWIIGDLNKLGHNETLFFRICAYLFDSICSPLSIYNIAKHVGSPAQQNIKKYIHSAINIFTIFPVLNYSIDQRQFMLDKNTKYYFLDPFIAWACYLRGMGITDNYYSNAQQILGKKPAVQSRLFENIVARELMSEFDEIGFFRTKDNQEIDFVGVIQRKIAGAFEAKNTLNYERSSYSWFTKRYPNIGFNIVDRELFVEMFPSRSSNTK